MADITFMSVVEIHERKWGTVQYPGRPSLAALMTSPIVALWTYKKRFVFSAHFKAQDLNEIVESLVRSGERTFLRECRLTKIYVNKQPVEFNIRIVDADKTPPKTVGGVIGAKIGDNPAASLPGALPFRPRTFSAIPEDEALKYGDVVKVKLPHLPGRQAEWRLIHKRLIFTPEDWNNDKTAKR